MRRCPGCAETLDPSDFSFKNRATGRLQVYCKRCSRTRVRDHYQRNITYYVDKALARNAKQRHASQDRVLAYLGTHPCVDCGESDPVVLDFDHVDPTTKSAVVAQMIKEAWAWSRIEAEIAKCVVRCANDHRRRTAQQFNWYRARPAPAGRP